MVAQFNSDNRKMNLDITITCNGTKKFRVWSEEVGKINSKYVDRNVIVTNSRTIYFSFPVSPKNLLIGCSNIENPNDKDFNVTAKEVPLKAYNIWMDEPTREFTQLAISFSQFCGFKPPSPRGTPYQNPDGRYTIKFYPVIKDFATGKSLSTPARIGHSSGIIETSSIRFNPYTIPSRFAILLHEYSHKYKNPKIGLQIGNESGADINAMYIYLGLGFSKIDAIHVFGNVFLKARTDSNILRMRKILDYICRFENQEYAQLN